ncbi:hypothetical protein [Paenibacillus sp. NPDC058174]|uniref:hypothetical protein n=1 Tax=Paenibacillus sp. NPDC058174 TaxID=3346366 RepID=UPI0036D9C32A
MAVFFSEDTGLTGIGGASYAIGTIKQAHSFYIVTERRTGGAKSGEGYGRMNRGAGA